MGQLSMRDVRKSFGTAEVIKGVSLDINHGEFVVFVGPSGCGKSTLLRMIAGLEEITAGDVTIDGKVVNDLAPVKRGISMVFQSYALYPHMSVYENIAFPLRVEKIEKDALDAKVKRASAILKLDERLKHKPGQLSGGQRQRVAIGRAIVRDPSVFLFDEPLSNLDAALRAEMRVELSKLHGELDATMIYVTHDQVEAMTMADRIVVLDGGVISQVGSPLELYHKPANIFVAGFIGNPKMNFMPVTCLSSTEKSITVSLPNNAEVTVPVVASGGVVKGTELTLGIRPEHVLPHAGEARVETKPTVVERLGIHTVIYATQEDTDAPFVSLLPGAAPVAVGKAAHLGLNGADCHLFDTDGAAFERDVALSDVDPSLLTQ
ncbi:ABC transporter ATP-binding protein [Loktanella sp. D2R18]|uniref:ABC transporter ATP-binding protein n=1 Tax=Rhodobacterales TaxID=204455 RepID=UPI000DE83EBD|nr:MULTISPECIES: sn-glycerol-3-phosphate ABC transporter ATP-binding protein UgpC [Rhodobacterales]MDO6591898.1 sn-glycerol-3-phosphate ABC transporter ATP-binding protein UgpC [Yoonia sp. 1_MG-2023]RBW42671.1 ABC transporter ATP-binding protein [Loktanella sp. D2R18]